MSIFIILLTGFISIYFSRIIFQRWFNPISLYAIVWMTILYLYELRLIYFIELSTYTWMVIIGAFLSFVLGALTIYSAKKTSAQQGKFTAKVEMDLFADKGKTLRYCIYVLSFIGLLSALQHWSVLLNKYGTILNVFLNAYHIYQARVSGELEGVVPYIWLVIYPAVFLAGIYTAYKGRLTLATLLPLIALILKEIANLSRAGLLFGFSEFAISFMLFRHLLYQQKIKANRFRIFIAIGVLISLLVLGATFVKSVRQTNESFIGVKNSFSGMSSESVISPSIYFYGASQVAVLNQFLEADKERASFGSNTFFTLYSALSKFNLLDQPSFIQPGYFIPNWSNTATYLREIYNDFGYSGIFLVPFLLGFLSTFYWYKFYETAKLNYLVVLTHLMVVVAISFFVLVVRSPAWTMGILFLLFIVPLLERLIQRKFLGYIS